MRAAFKKGGEVTVRDAELRAPNTDEIRLKVEACGICGTDLHRQAGDDKQEGGFGHEMAGTILEAGAHVSRVAVGDRVAIESSSACGQCANCRNVRLELCTNTQSFWPLGNFGFAEEIIVPAINAIPVGELSPDVACLGEPLGVAVDMVRLADIEITSNVLLIGPGPIGLMALALAKRAGARRIFVAGHRRRTARVDLAMRLGADAFIDPTETPLPEFDFGCLIDRVLVTAPPQTLNDAFAVASKAAIVSLIGIQYGEGAYCNFNVNDFHFKKLQLRASFASPALYTPLALQYLQEGVVDGEALISHRYPLERIGEAMDTARSDTRAVKIVINP